MRAKLLLTRCVTDAGASDCAACVAIQIEMARAMLADPKLELPAPVVFAFNGGEETLSQAAHGYMAQSQFASELGAFINIESTGPGGPDILFQHTGIPELLTAWLDKGMSILLSHILLQGAWILHMLKLQSHAHGMHEMSLAG